MKDYEEFCLLAESQPTFRRNISPLFSGSKNNPSKKPLELATFFTLVSCSADFQRTTRRYNPEDRNLVRYTLFFYVITLNIDPFYVARTVERPALQGTF
jgi:hypothetical protein